MLLSPRKRKDKDKNARKRRGGGDCLLLQLLLKGKTEGRGHVRLLLKRAKKPRGKNGMVETHHGLLKNMPSPGKKRRGKIFKEKGNRSSRLWGGSFKSQEATEEKTGKLSKVQ